MTFCGFDEKMLAGIDDLLAGVQKAVQDGDVVARLTQERDEMTAFLVALPRVSDQLRQEQLRGLWLLGKTFCDGALKQIANGQDPIIAMELERQNIRNLLVDIDNHFYGPLQREKAYMPQLMDYISTKVTSENKIIVKQKIQSH